MKGKELHVIMFIDDELYNWWDIPGKVCKISVYSFWNHSAGHIVLIMKEGCIHN